MGNGTSFFQREAAFYAREDARLAAALRVPGARGTAPLRLQIEAEVLTPPQRAPLSLIRGAKAEHRRTLPRKLDLDTNMRGDRFGEKFAGLKADYESQLRAMRAEMEPLEELVALEFWVQGDLRDQLLAPAVVSQALALAFDVFRPSSMALRPRVVTVSFDIRAPDLRATGESAAKHPTPLEEEACGTFFEGFAVHLGLRIMEAEESEPPVMPQLSVLLAYNSSGRTDYEVSAEACVDAAKHFMGEAKRLKENS